MPIGNNSVFQLKGEDKMIHTLIVSKVFLGTKQNWPVRGLVDSLTVTQYGIEGDRDCRPDKRPISVTTEEELVVITGRVNSLSKKLVLTRTLTAGDLGINIQLCGMEGFSLLNENSSLHFFGSDGTEGPILVVVKRMKPCIDMGNSLAQRFPGLAGELFPKAATTMPGNIYRRGLALRVDDIKSGIIRTGDMVQLISL